MEVMKSLLYINIINLATGYQQVSDSLNANVNLQSMKSDGKTKKTVFKHLMWTTPILYISTILSKRLGEHFINAPSLSYTYVHVHIHTHTHSHKLVCAFNPASHTHNLG
jgi:hypothetical protein